MLARLILVCLAMLFSVKPAVAAPNEYYAYYNQPTYQNLTASGGVIYGLADVVNLMQVYGWGLTTGYRCSSYFVNFNSGGSTSVAPGTLAPYQTDLHGTAYAVPIHLSNCVFPYNNPPTAIGDRDSGSSPISRIVCNPGYGAVAVFSTVVQCVPDVAQAQLIDALNEHGAPSDCVPCLAELAGGQIAHLTSAGLNKGDPVNVANGNVSQEEFDYQGAGGNLISFSRYYNSGKGFTDSRIGSNWRHNYMYTAVVGDGAADSVVLVRPDGSSLNFIFDAATGKYKSSASVKGSLTRVLQYRVLKNLNFVLNDGTQETYNNYGQITSLALVQGGLLTFVNNNYAVTSVSDNRGHVLTFTYASVGGQPRLSTVKTPDARIVSFGYDAYGRLVSATYPDAAVRRYSYLSQSASASFANPSSAFLTQIIDGNGSIFASIGYDSLGRGATTMHGVNAEQTTFSYATGSTTVVSSTGAMETLTFGGPVNRPQAQSISTTCVNGCGPIGTVSDQFVYDTNANAVAVLNKLGGMSCIAYSPRNLPIKVVSDLTAGADCAGALSSPPSFARVKTVQWHTQLSLPLATSGPQGITSFSYDSAGRTLSQTIQETSDLTGASGFGAAVVGPARTTSFTYDAQGSILSIKSPRTSPSSTTLFAYDSAENLISTTSPTGLVTTVSNYDGNGRPGLVTAPNGLQTSLTYDARGRTVQIATGGSVTSYGYDAAGLLVNSTLPSGLSLSFGYDTAHRLTWSQDSLGNRSDRVLDSEGNVLQESVTGNGGALAFRRQAAYDQLSRTTSLTKAQ